MWSVATDGVAVTWSVCVLVTTVSPAKTDKPTEMPFAGSEPDMVQGPTRVYHLNRFCRFCAVTVVTNTHRHRQIDRNGYSNSRHLALRAAMRAYVFMMMSLMAKANAGVYHSCD